MRKSLAATFFVLERSAFDWQMIPLKRKDIHYNTGSWQEMIVNRKVSLGAKWGNKKKILTNKRNPRDLSFESHEYFSDLQFVRVQRERDFIGCTITMYLPVEKIEKTSDTCQWKRHLLPITKYEVFLCHKKNENLTAASAPHLFDYYKNQVLTFLSWLQTSWLLMRGQSASPHNWSPVDHKVINGSANSLRHHWKL